MNQHGENLVYLTDPVVDFLHTVAGCCHFGANIGEIVNAFYVFSVESERKLPLRGRITCRHCRQPKLPNFLYSSSTTSWRLMRRASNNNNNLFSINLDWVVHSSVLPQNFGLLCVDLENNCVGCFARTFSFCWESWCLLDR